MNAQTEINGIKLFDHGAEVGKVYVDWGESKEDVEIRICCGQFPAEFVARFTMSPERACELCEAIGITLRVLRHTELDRAYEALERGEFQSADQCRATTSGVSSDEAPNWDEEIPF